MPNKSHLSRALAQFETECTKAKATYEALMLIIDGLREARE